METDLIISAIDEIHKKANRDLENRDAIAYVTIFNDALRYTKADGKTLNKRDFTYDLDKSLKSAKSFETSHYRIKSSVENDIFIEKIARKSVIIKSNLLIFSKKQTIQTEEVYHWQNINGEWKVTSVEVVLEEKY